MRPIQGVKLEELVKTAEEKLIDLKRSKTTDFIQDLLRKIEILDDEIEKSKLEYDQFVNKRKEAIRQIDIKIALLKKGDWSVLKENIQGITRTDEKTKEEGVI